MIGRVLFFTVLFVVAPLLVILKYTGSDELYSDPELAEIDSDDHPRFEELSFTQKLKIKRKKYRQSHVIRPFCVGEVRECAFDPYTRMGFVWIKRKDKSERYIEFPFENIKDYRIICEDGRTETNGHTITRAAAGAVLAGPVGALVGVATGAGQHATVGEVSYTIYLQDGDELIKFKALLTGGTADRKVMRRCLTDIYEVQNLLEEIITGYHTLV